MGEKTIWKGGVLERSLDDGTSWQKMLNCKRPAVPSNRREYLDATDMDSEGDFQEFAPGMFQSEELEISRFWTAEAYAQALEDVAHTETTGKPVWYRLTMRRKAVESQGRKFEWKGFASVGQDVGELTELSEFTYMIQRTGPSTTTAPEAA
ncbi:hypothetical protein AN189_18095 [Loktanella sp. 3ANDIMAR09]|uniref:hypothetical protein n=1 Tax=Loktanella sp. 3ANDIMAR09 TaxID=1225657 RepID=UPI0006F2C214|nr:hypothetical protein [Loktanella sp. 3ANDIMAR09]KQI66967.1 hypothetical protein AN189_18095 [Loktanella sp. 3ANDIMAR09]